MVFEFKGLGGVLVHSTLIVADSLEEARKLFLAHNEVATIDDYCRERGVSKVDIFRRQDAEDSFTPTEKGVLSEVEE